MGGGGGHDVLQEQQNTRLVEHVVVVWAVALEAGIDQSEVLLKGCDHVVHHQRHHLPRLRY
jgi:hypothetical protein